MEQPMKVTGKVGEPSKKDGLSFYISVKGFGNIFCEATPRYEGRRPELGDTVLLTGTRVVKVGASAQGFQGSEAVFLFDLLEILPE